MAKRKSVSILTLVQPVRRQYEAGSMQSWQADGWQSGSASLARTPLAKALSVHRDRRPVSQAMTRGHRVKKRSRLAFRSVRGLR